MVRANLVVVNTYIRTHAETDTDVYVHGLTFQLRLLEGTGSGDTSVAQSATLDTGAGQRKHRMRLDSWLCQDVRTCSKDDGTCQKDIELT